MIVEIRVTSHELKQKLFRSFPVESLNCVMAAQVEDDAVSNSGRESHEVIVEGPPFIWGVERIRLMGKHNIVLDCIGCSDLHNLSAAETSLRFTENVGRVLDKNRWEIGLLRLFFCFLVRQRKRVLGHLFLQKRGLNGSPAKAAAGFA